MFEGIHVAIMDQEQILQGTVVREISAYEAMYRKFPSSAGRVQTATAIVGSTKTDCGTNQ